MSDETTNQPQPKPTSNVSLRIALFILICSIGLFGFYLLYSQNHLAAKQQVLQEKLDLLHLSLAQQQLSLQKFAAKQKNSSTNVLLPPEISYLVKTANLSLLVDHDIANALKLLTTAKQYLSDQPEFSTLNSAIDQDIVTLQAAATVDIDKLILRLETLQRQLTAVDANVLLASPKTATPPAKVPVSFWQKILNSALQELRHAFIIKNRGDADASPLTSEQLAGAKLNIQFKLSQAEWALMQRNPALYQSALQSAHAWLCKYFPGRDITTQFLKELQELQSISIPTKPKIQASLKEILNY